MKKELPWFDHVCVNRTLARAIGHRLLDSGPSTERAVEAGRNPTPLRQ